MSLGISFIRKMCSVIVKKPWTVKLPAKWRGGTIEKWGNYWMGVAQDYKEVSVDVFVTSRNKPLKAAIYISLIGGYIYAFQTNPDELEFQDALQKCMNQSAMLSEKIRNPQVDEHFQNLSDCFNHGLIRRSSLGIVSLLWIDNYAKFCGVYKSRCDYLKPRYVTFHERVVDIGFLGTWWILNKKMEEFDINPNEWVESTVQDESPS
ncbi:hypothetical protein SK128_025884 [Halocaridina rubra]|uniref:Mitochondrial import inner membrane translocase subunit Tim29 n=1 Tax=Halocaridina rubra TaxID=373956 RepID=A0AAN9AGM6_HALRR